VLRINAVFQRFAWLERNSVAGLDFDGLTKDSVTLVGFGTFLQRHRGARTGKSLAVLEADAQPYWRRIPCWVALWASMTQAERDSQGTKTGSVSSSGMKQTSWRWRLKRVGMISARLL
jgi:hypothetical protein